MVPKLKTDYPSVQEKIFLSTEKIALTKIRIGPTPPTITAHQTATRPTVLPVKVASSTESDDEGYITRDSPRGWAQKGLGW
jgi:hypothetical protein